MTIHARLNTPPTRTTELGDVFRSLVRHMLEVRPDEGSRKVCRGIMRTIIELESERIRLRELDND